MKFIIIDLSTLDTFKNIDGYTEVFTDKFKAIDVAQQFLSSYKVIEL